MEHVCEIRGYLIDVPPGTTTAAFYCTTHDWLFSKHIQPSKFGANSMCPFGALHSRLDLVCEEIQKIKESRNASTR